jgi:hypothetical protein
MNRKMLSQGFALFACVFVAMAADVSGKWTVEQGARPDGSLRVSTFDFKVDGNTLTGTLTAPGRGGADPTVTPISNGKVDGDKISFDVTRQMQGYSFTTKYVFTGKGDEMAGTATSPGMGGDPQTRDVSARRAKT